MAKGWDRDLVARLSPSASQVLLSLLLSGQVETRQSLAEFAKTTGLGQRTIAPALLELESEGLITIIAQPGKPSIVRLVQAEELRHETTVTEVDLPGIAAPDRPLLRGGAAESGEGTGRRVGEESNEQPPDDSGGSGGVAVPGGGGLDGDEVQAGEQGHTVSESVEQVALPDRQTAYEVHPTTPVDSEEALIAACRMADESKDGELRVAALQDVWDFAFPYGEWPSQRLSNSNARQLLVNRSAEWVGQFVLDRVSKSSSRIMAPLPYIQAALAGEEKRSAQQKVGEGQSISDDLRRLAQLGKEQFGAKNKDSPGDFG